MKRTQRKKVDEKKCKRERIECTGLIRTAHTNFVLQSICVRVCLRALSVCVCVPFIRNALTLGLISSRAEGLFGVYRQIFNYI